MSQETINELMDNIIERIDAESDTQGAPLTYLVWITDPDTGMGDMRFNGDLDSLVSMSVRAQHTVVHKIEGKGGIEQVVKMVPEEVE